MAYTSPKLTEVSLQVSEMQRNFGADTQEGCKRSCCFGGGKDW